MTGNGKESSEERLTLLSRMSDMAQLAPWIEGLAVQYKIPCDMQFAMNLCLEEVLSNAIQHGYSNNPDLSIAVQFSNPQDGHFIFVVEDEAPPFNPLALPELPALNSVDEIRVGGHGIRLLRRFAGDLAYQATPTGNRLTIGFSIATRAITKA